MNRKIRTIGLILLMTGQILYGQTTNSTYIIDNSIKSQVDKKVKSFGKITMSSMDFRIYENDSLIINTYSNDKSIENMTMAILESDTINIIGFIGMFAGFGYQITLFKDTCIVRYFAKSDMEIYKLHKNDSLEFGVSVPCVTYKLALSQKPNFKKGKVLEGIIELTSDDYYEVSNGEENKYKVQLTGYFRSSSLENISKNKGDTVKNKKNIGIVVEVEDE